MLIIIGPCLLDMINKQITRANAFGLGLGIALFVTAHFAFLSRMIWPIVFVVTGVVFLLIPES